MNHKHLLSTLAVSCLAAAPLAVSADAAVTNTFTGGNPAVAAEVNQNFQDLVDAINGIDTSGGIAAEPVVGASFNIPTGGTSATKYGTLLAEEGTDCWQARVFYDNTANEQIDTAGGTATPDHIWRTMKGCSGQPLADFDYTYGIPDSRVDEVNRFGATDGVEIDTRFAEGGAFDYRIEQTIVTANGVDNVHQIEIYEDGTGEVAWVADSSHTRSVIGQLTIAGEVFTNVAITSVLGGKRLSVAAEGVGTVATIDVGALNFVPDPIFDGTSGDGTTTTIRNFVFSRGPGGDRGTLPAPFQSGGAFGDVFN